VFVSRVAKYVRKYLAGIMSLYQKEREEWGKEGSMMRNSRVQSPTDEQTSMGLLTRAAKL
jgi:hypothetical protein